MIYSISNVF